MSYDLITRPSIDEGDIVRVDFNNSQFTLSYRAKVLYKPCAAGDIWVFEDIDNGTVHYVSECCTISKERTK